MAVASDPSITTIATEGLKRGGRRNPTSGEISDAEDLYFKSAKSRIQRIVKKHPLQRLQIYDSTVKGQRTYDQPTALHTPITVTLLDGPDTFRGTAQSGSSTSITFASDFDVADTDRVVGDRVLITGGTGVDQCLEITAYNNSTKVGTVHTSWDTNPDSSSTYLVSDQEYELWDYKKHSELNRIVYGAAIQRPYTGAFVGETFVLGHAPDKIYGLHYDFYADLDQLDETGTQFVKILREWHDLWVQAIAIETMQRFDDERYPQELAFFTAALERQQDEALDVGQVQFVDV